MAVILGTVPGWERDSDWSSDNRTYRGPGYTKYIGETIIEEESHYYRMVANITIYLYESPCSQCNVAITRTINDIEIIGLYTNEYSGGLDRWVSAFSKLEAEELLSRSNDEVGGLLDCMQCTRFDIDIIESEYVPPTPKIPQSAIRLYSELRSEIERERRNIESLTRDIESIYEETPREDLTPEEIREIRNLNNEIRDSNSIIREDETEMRNLERQFPGIEET